MKRIAFVGFAVSVGLAIGACAGDSTPVAPITTTDSTTTSTPTPTPTTTPDPAGVVSAANAFLAALSTDQRGKVLFSFTPVAKASTYRNGNFVGEQYGQAVWSNYPVSDVPRPGLAFGTLSAAQQAAETTLLQSVLSAKGYQKVVEIMGSDQALANGGTNFSSGKAYYTIGIFGTPSATTPWMIEFGGHHLGLNIVIDGAHGVMTPTLTGAQPAVYTLNGTTVRVLAQENDKGFALLTALDDTQRKQAILTYTVSDLVLGPGHDGETIVPEGLKASAMTTAQRTLLLDLITEWAGIISDTYSAERIAEITATLDNTYFAWSGPTTHTAGKNGSSYYRIQGPKVIIEFSPQGVGGDPTNHVHTIYRDPTNEYGTAYTLK